MARETILTGQLDLLVLAILARRPAHGYAILEALRIRSGGLLDLPEGSLYPALPRIREVSAHIAAAVADVAYKRGLASGQAPKDLLAFVQSQMYDPHY